MNISTAIQSFTSYIPMLTNSLDSISASDIPEVTEGELVRFKDFYTGKVGYGVIKRFTIDEFLNPDYDDTDPETSYWIYMDCAVIVNADDNAFQNYVPMTHIYPVSLAEYLNEYSKDITDATNMQYVRMLAIGRMAEYSGGFGYGYVPEFELHEPKATTYPSIQTSQFTSESVAEIFGGVR